MQDDFPNKQLIEDLFAEGKWGFRNGALKRLAGWVVSANEKINFLERENKRLVKQARKENGMNEFDDEPTIRRDDWDRPVTAVVVDEPVIVRDWRSMTIAAGMVLGFVVVAWVLWGVL